MPTNAGTYLVSTFAPAIPPRYLPYIFLCCMVMSEVFPRKMTNDERFPRKIPTFYLLTYWLGFASKYSFHFPLGRYYFLILGAGSRIVEALLTFLDILRKRKFIRFVALTRDDLYLVQAVPKRVEVEVFKVICVNSGM